MCWSGQASFTLAACGFMGAYFAAKQNKHPAFRWVPLAYFSGMETLQGFTYFWIGQCGNNYNATLTTLSYLHIAFQPWFVTMFCMSFRPADTWRKYWWAWLGCAVTTSVFLAMLLVPTFPGTCSTVGQNLCGEVTCSYHGEWHIAWMLQLSNLDPHYMSYFIVAFIFPILYGSWRMGTYHFLCGPFLMFFLSRDKNEQPAIWCLLSIALLLATHIPSLNKWLHGGKVLES